MVGINLLFAYCKLFKTLKHFEASITNSVDSDHSLIWVHTTFASIRMLNNKHTLSNDSYFAGVLKFKYLLSLLRCYCTMIQLHVPSNKTTTRF